MMRSSAEVQAWQRLDRDIERQYRQYRPELLRCFVQHVYARGPGAAVLLKDELVSWQAVGRRLFGQDFVTAFKRLVKEKAGK